MKVLEVEADTNKVALSMKLVDQTSGRDEDPDNSEAADSRGQRGGGQRGPMKFSDATIVGSTSLDKDKQIGGGKWDLVGSDEEEAYKAEADMEAMWAMRDAGVEDDPVSSAPAAAAEGGGDGGGALIGMEKLLAQERARLRRHDDAKEKKQRKKEKKDHKSKKKRHKKEGKKKKRKNHSASSSSAS